MESALGWPDRCLLLVLIDNAYVQTVEADGHLCTAEPASSLPLTQAYYVF